MLASLSLSLPQKELPTAAWIALALIVIFVLVLNVGLISALRHKDNGDYKVLQRFGSAIRNPNQQENQMLDELNTRVKSLNDTGGQDNSVESPPEK